MMSSSVPCSPFSSSVAASQHVTKRQFARVKNVNINAGSGSVGQNGSCVGFPSWSRSWCMILLLVIASCVHISMYHFLTSSFVSSTDPSSSTHDQIQQSRSITHRVISHLRKTTILNENYNNNITQQFINPSKQNHTPISTQTQTQTQTPTSTSTETSTSIMSSSLATWSNDIPKPKSSRNYTLQPILIHRSLDLAESCSVPCQYRSNPLTAADVNWNGDVVSTMESAAYQPNTDVDVAHRAGAKYVLTPRLSSDVPCPYFSWSEYKIVDTTGVDVIPSRYGVNNNTGSIAIAVISNCAGSSFRLAAITKLEEHGVSVAKYGSCFGQTLPGHKIPTLQKYLFTLAFENSIDADYVTEKFWQPLEAGSIPVVIGTATIFDFAPRRNRSMLYISSIEDVPRVAKQMLYLSTNMTAYREYLEWKSRPDRSFLAVVDLASVHSRCRLCIHVATDITYRDASLSYQQSQCWYNNYRRIFIRERGRFDFYPLVIDINTFDFNNNTTNNNKNNDNNNNNTNNNINNNTNRNLNIFYNMVTQLLISKHPHPVWYPRPFFPDHQSFYMDHNNGQQIPIFQFYSIYPAFVSTSHPMSNDGNHTTHNGITITETSTSTSTSQRQITQREALFGPHAIDTELELKTLLYSDTCPYLEVIFV